MVGSAVATIVWSSDASTMPSMSAPMITRTRRCSARACSDCVALASGADIGYDTVSFLYRAPQGRHGREASMVRAPTGLTDTEVTAKAADDDASPRGRRLDA